MTEATQAYQARRGRAPRSLSTPHRSAACQYAAQRRLGFAWLRFAATLEQEFREGLFTMNVMRVRLAAMLGIFGVAGFVVLDANLQSLMTQRAVNFLLFLGLPACMLAMIISFTRRPTARLQYLLVVCATLVSVSDVGAVLASRLVHGWFPYESIVLVTLYSYFLAGLLYRQAMAVGLIVLGAFLGGRLFVPDGMYSMHYETYYLLVANTIGWIGLYFFEYHQRLSFLLERELSQRALLDGLTGTLNRSTIRKHLNLTWRQAQRDQRAVGTLVIDIDHFKSINDVHGHLVGDACLRAVSDVLAGCGRRPLDAVGRIGGDEFLVAWYDIDLEGFDHLCAMIRERVAALRIDGAPGVILQVSGGGVLAWPTPQCKLVTALQLADTKLYEAKRSGRGSILTEACNTSPGMQLLKSA
jgi:diguanylate cyclase (GGDEF)-like protein